MKKIILLGSGALKIGQAGEFDYSGSQAIKALKEEGINVILINPNIASVQTSKGLADKVYLLPVDHDTVAAVIKKEKPDGIMLSFGGQIALNCGIELSKSGVLKKYNVKVLGTSIDSILATEDRELFKNKLKEININYAKSIATNSINESLNAVKKIGYPVIVRASYALGGLGSGICYDHDQFVKKITMTFSYCPQILIEEYLEGWKEIEYEIVRDSYDNCITVCNMENFDPMGIHTGDSIVVAPSQTLSNKEYNLLRTIAIKTIRHLKIVGECNIQYAFNQKTNDYRVIEVNARLSRSSALASKATGYPLAYVAAKIALGYPLNKIKNCITKTTTAMFEPALDYIVVKIPKWEFEKFPEVDDNIDTCMKSIGEVMSIGTTFEEALQKAIRMLGYENSLFSKVKFTNNLNTPNSKRIFEITKFLMKGFSIDFVYEKTHIDRWFLSRIKNLCDVFEEINLEKIKQYDFMKKIKTLGFSDYQIAKKINCKEKTIRNVRKSLNVYPVLRQIDTLAGEFPSKTNFLYLSYNSLNSEINNLSKKEICLVLGSGPYSIGSSVEFDWCVVSAVKALKKIGKKTIVLNCNPETVSTDHDESDFLVFENIDIENINAIKDIIGFSSVATSFGGQTSNNIVETLFKNNVPVMSMNENLIGIVESRSSFSKILDNLKINQPRWQKIDRNIKNLNLNYPILLRPSFVLSGKEMKIITCKKELNDYIENSNLKHITATEFIENALEVEIDGVALKGEIYVSGISEHLEPAGVHSGDSTLIFPAHSISKESKANITKNAQKIIKYLNYTGPFNMQFMLKENVLSVIECNLRASRSFPLISKSLNLNFIDAAICAMNNIDIKRKNCDNLKYYCVKSPQFSFARLPNVNPELGVKMKSTGEAGCFGNNFYEACLASMNSVGYPFKFKKVFFDYDVLCQNIINCFKIASKNNKKIYTLSKNKKDLSEFNNIVYIDDNDGLSCKIDIVITSYKEKSNLLIYKACIDLNIPLFTNEITGYNYMVSSINTKSLNIKTIKDYQEKK